MIAVIDYDSGNLTSVCNALDRLGATYRLVNDPEALKQATKVIFPGQGAAGQAMAALKRRNLEQSIRALKVPYLGICIGMQLLYDASEEDDATLLGVIPGKLQRFSNPSVKVPQIGWNTVKRMDQPMLLEQIPDESFFYFVHSYAAAVSSSTGGVSFYGQPFSSLVQHHNFWGVQFHPEKSGEAGARLIRNFLQS